MADADPSVARPEGLPPGFRLHPAWIAPEPWFSLLLADTPWERGEVRLYGRTFEMPRRIAWYGPAPYRYSGHHHPARPLTGTLDELRLRVEATTGRGYNAVLLNLYRDGVDSMGWHHDADYDAGDNPSLASVSFGAARVFQVRERTGPGRWSFLLPSGSLLWMGDDVQARFQHALPKTRRPLGPRINLTFRWMAG